MDLQLGKPVVTSDGVHIGTVDRLIIDPAAKEFRECIVHRGVLFAEDRLVEEQLIERIDDDGTVHLSVDADHANLLPRVAGHEFIVPRIEEYPHVADVTAGGLGPLVLMRADALGAGYTHVTRGFGEPVPAAMPATELQSNLPGEAVLIGAGTDVVGCDGKKIGTVADILYDTDGEVQGITVKAGLLSHHLLHVSRDQIATITHGRITLTVTADAVDQAGTSAPGS